MWFAMEPGFANSFARTLIEQFGREGSFTVSVEPADMDIVIEQLEKYGCRVERVPFRNELSVDTNGIVVDASALV
jgi:hypothetical protein